MNPFAVLAFPGIYIAYKINEFKKQCQEKSKEKITERELALLHQKIDRLMTRLENARLEVATCREEECVICISSKATMQTFPCGHRVVCQKCFMKTVHAAVSQRRLPLRCVVCRAQVLRLKNYGRNAALPRPAWQPISSGHTAGQRKSLQVEKSEYSGFTVGSIIQQSCKTPCVLHKHKPKPNFAYTRMEEISFTADDVKRASAVYASGHVPYRHRRGRRKRQRRHCGHISPALFPIPEKEELELAEVGNLGKSAGSTNEDRKGSPKTASEQRHHLEKSSRKKSLSIFGSLHITLMNRSPLKVFKEKYHHLM